MAVDDVVTTARKLQYFMFNTVRAVDGEVVSSRQEIRVLMGILILSAEGITANGAGEYPL